MFVSSYSTYINSNSSEKQVSSKIQKAKEQTSSFVLDPTQGDVLESKKSAGLPLNYISNYKVFNNKQKLQDDETYQDKDKAQYTHSKTIQNAKDAYADNSKIFSFFIEPKATQSQTLHVDNNTRHKAINTYLANDSYYQITA